jgi:hypothetical protein
MGDMLVGAHNHQTTLLPVQSACIKYVRPRLEIGAEDLFIVDKPKPALARLEERRQLFEHKIARGLLEDRANIENGIDILSSRGEAANGRAGIFVKKPTKPGNSRVRQGRIFFRTKRKKPPARISLDDMAKLDRLGIGKADDRRRMEARADPESGGEGLPAVCANQP